MWTILKRGLRTALPLIALVASGAIQSNPETLVLMPTLNAFGKYLRDKFPKNKLLDQALPF